MNPVKLNIDVPGVRISNFLFDSKNPAYLIEDILSVGCYVSF